MNAFEIVKIGMGLGRLGRNFQYVCLFQFIFKPQCLLSLLVIVNVREILIKFSTKFSSCVWVCVCAFHVKREFFHSCCMQFIFVALRIWLKVERETKKRNLIDDGWIYWFLQVNDAFKFCNHFHLFELWDS